MKRAMWCGLLCLTCVAVVRADNQTAAATATISVKALQANVQPGGTVTVEAYISGAPNVAAYQIMVGATGGDKGTLTVDSMSIDRARPDFALFNTGAEILDVQDKKAGWIGLVRVSGATDMVKPVYVATFTFKASSDAAGTFKLNVRTDNTDSFILDLAATQVPHKVGAAVEITVGGAAPTRTDGRKKE